MNHSQHFLRLLLALFLLLLCQHGIAQTFGSLTKFSNSWTPQNGTLIDLNADGNPDLITTAANTIYIRTGNGTGGFNTTPITLSNTSGSLTSVAVADFNGDGRLDIAVTQPFAGPPVLVLFLNSSNSPLAYSAATSRAVGASDFFTSPSTVAGDFNNDGRQDIAISANDNVLVYLNSGTGTSAATRFPGVSGNPNGTITGLIEVSGLVSGDINNDGRIDLLVDIASGGGRILRSTLSGSNVSFASTSTTYPLLLLANVNGDANLDIVTTNFTNTVSVYLGNGTGGFGSANNFSISPTNRLTVGDYNGDGRIDIATVGVNALNVPIISVLRNTSNSPLNFVRAGISVATSATTTSFPVELLRGDLNNDERPDIIIGRPRFQRSH